MITSRLVVSRGQWEEGMGTDYLKWAGGSFWGDESFLDLGSGAVCPVLWMK